MAGTFNLFRLLDLDPTARWDAVTFEKRLKEKQNEWARLANHPKKALEAKGNIERIPQLREVAGNPDMRAAHAAEAKSARETQRAGRVQELEEVLTLLQAKGHLLASELADLVKRFADLGSESELRSRIRVPINTKSPQAEATPGNDGLEASVARQIEEHLTKLNKRDLYDFLGLDRNTSIAELKRKADEIYDDCDKNANKDVDNTLRSQLVGQCRAHLNTPVNKARYDATLENARFDTLRGRADIVARETKTLSAAAVEILLAQFRAGGGAKASVDAALRVLRAHATRKGWTLEIPQGAVERVSSARACGYCSLLNDATVQHCTHCGKPLEEECPKCDTKAPTDQGACGKCGFPTGNRRYVDVLCQEAAAACGDKNFAAAHAHCAQAAAGWPGVNRGLLAVRIAALRRQITEGLALQVKYVDELRGDVRERRFFRADGRLRDSSSVFPAAAAELAQDRQLIQEALSDVARALKRARELPGSDEQKIDAYSQVLEISVDCQEALNAMAAFPPDPPTNLRAVVEGAQVRLSWDAAAVRGTSYIVMRHASTRPTGLDAGDTVDKAKGATWQDPGPDLGLPLYYAVFSERGGVRSRNAAHLQEPILVLDEAKDLRADAGNGHIVLSWRPPRAAQRIIVRRGQDTAPRTVTEGADVSVAPDGCSATDRRLTNGERYHYTVFAQFAGPGGRDMLTTPGIRVTVTPEEPPAPVQELLLTAEGAIGSRKIRLSWKAPARGHVLVFSSDQPFKLTCGERRLRADLQPFGSPLARHDESATEQLTGQRLRYYLAVTMLNDVAIVGQQRIYRNVDECTNLTCQSLGGALRLKWRWPAGCTQVRVGHSSERFVTEQEASLVTLAQYQVRGYWDVSNPAQLDKFVVVFADYRMPDGSVYSSAGCRKLVRIGSRITVSYEIKRGFFKGPFKLELKVTGSGTVPAMVVVRKARMVPTSRTEGEAILRIEAIPPGTRRLVLPIPNEACMENTFGQLFMEDDDAYDTVTLQKPAHERLRLF